MLHHWPHFVNQFNGFLTGFPVSFFQIYLFVEWWQINEYVSICAASCSMLVLLHPIFRFLLGSCIFWIIVVNTRSNDFRQKEWRESGKQRNTGNPNVEHLLVSNYQFFLVPCKSIDLFILILIYSNCFIS